MSAGKDDSNPLPFIIVVCLIAAAGIVSANIEAKVEKQKAEAREEQRQRVQSPAAQEKLARAQKALEQANQTPAPTPAVPLTPEEERMRRAIAQPQRLPEASEVR